VSVSSVLHVLGRLCLLFGGLLLVPLALALFESGFGNPVARALLGSSACSCALGLVLHLSFAKHVEEFDFEEAFAVVASAWVAFTLLGALPYWLSGAIPGVTDAAFESISGLSTTGASILNDPAQLGRPLLLWRALTHWVGGMGVIMLSLAILPALGAGGNFLFQAESTGSDSERLAPRIRDVSRILWLVYVGLTLLGVVAFALAGMSVFDAVCHSFATVATGGFSTRADSLASFAPAVQWTAVALMVLAGLNQALLFAALLGRPLQLLRNVETRTWLSLLALASLLGLWVLGSRAPELDASVLDVVFTVVSISSTTGFATVDFGLWPEPLHVVVLLLMLGGACGGSTSGSAKMFRHLLWVKSAWRELQRLLRPSGVFVVKAEGRPIAEPVVTRSVAYLVFYLCAACLGTLLLTLLGVGGEESLSGMVTCLSGVGPGLGAVGPASNFAGLPGAGKWLLMLAMLLGRLEFFAVLVLFSPLAWRR